MAQVNAGRVRFIGRGEYDNSTQYYTFDLVNYNGNSYFAKSNTMGNLPTNSTYWQLVAEKGNVGPAGPTGNGIDHISLTSQSGATKTYTIYFTDGNTTTFTVEDGEVTQEVFDEEIEHANMIYNAMPKVSGEGTDLTLNNTAECPVYDIELSPSELEQETTSISEGDEYDSPSPEHPQEIHTVSGENSVKVGNKNLAKETFDSKLYLTGSGNNRTVVERASTLVGEIIKVKPNTSYTISGDWSNFGDSSIRFGLFDNIPVVNATSTKHYNTNSSITFTTDNTTNYILLYNTFSRNTTAPQIFLCETQYATTYEPHQEQSLPLSLGDLEYCKIGYYEDEFYKATESDTGLTAGKWYLKKNIGKLILDGSETGWTQVSLTSGIRYYFNKNDAGIPQKNSDGTDIFSNNFKGIKYATYYSSGGVNGITYSYYNNNTSIQLFFLQPFNDLIAFKSWLSNHNTSFYYQTTTPTYTLLSNTLQTQLDNIHKAITYQDQTNVSQTNNDLPFIIKMSAIRDLSGIFEEI